MFNPFKINSAEILQINSSKSILLGDQNRTLTVKLSCVDVNDNDELKATNLLKKEFPRGSKVKIKPVSFEEDTLLGEIFDIKDSKEMSKILIAQNLTKDNCTN